MVVLGGGVVPIQPLPGILLSFTLINFLFVFFLFRERTKHNKPTTRVYGHSRTHSSACALCAQLSLADDKQGRCRKLYVSTRNCVCTENANQRRSRRSRRKIPNFNPLRNLRICVWLCAERMNTICCCQRQAELKDCFWHYLL